MRRRRWTTEDDLRIAELRKGGASWVEIGKVFDVAPDTVRKRLERSNISLLETEKEKIRTQQQRQLSAEEIRKLASGFSLLDRLKEYLREAILALPPSPPPKTRTEEEGGHLIEETHVLMLSDWHAYETISLERLRGINAYDADVFSRRVLTIVRGVLNIKGKLETAGWRFRKLVCALNGDFVSGTIHEVEKHLDAPNIVMAAYGTAYVLAQAIRDLAAEYEEVVCYGTPGNHGRLPDARNVSGKDPLRSWDMLIYLIAKEMLRDQRNVTVIVPESEAACYEVEGWRFLQLHGHNVKSWNQIPWYGVQRAVGVAALTESALDERLHYVLLGHFHTPTSLVHSGVEVFVNGSLIGPTEWSLPLFGLQDPSQVLLSVHREFGVTSRWIVRGERKEITEKYENTPWREL